MLRSSRSRKSSFASLWFLSSVVFLRWLSRFVISFLKFFERFLFSVRNELMIGVFSKSSRSFR